MKSLVGRTAVITGAASGIGQATAVRLASEGMQVVLADVDATALDAVAAEIGSQAMAVVTDVSDQAAVEALAERAVARFGAVHVLCNIAGVESGGRFSDIPAPTWRWVLDVNVMGVVHCCAAFLPILREQDEAHIINASSIAAFSARTPTFAPYIASKSAVLGLTESLAIEEHAAGSSVTVSALVPGPTRTRMVDAERNRPEEVPATADDVDRSAVADALRETIDETGMDPAMTAEHIVHAIRDGRFYILTHPELAFAGLAARDAWMRGGSVQSPSVVGRTLR